MEEENEAKDAAVVIVQWMGTLYTSCFDTQSKMIALEIILKISLLMPFDFRLNQALPWIM